MLAEAGMLTVFSIQTLGAGWETERRAPCSTASQSHRGLDPSRTQADPPPVVGGSVLKALTLGPKRPPSFPPPGTRCAVGAQAPVLPGHPIQVSPAVQPASHSHTTLLRG